ncbi:MAG: DUF5916 domain-containing protein [bacterium]
MVRNLRFRFLIFTLTWVSTVSLWAAPDKILQLKKTPANIAVDGVIDLSWNQADSVVDFVQLQPYAGKDPSTKTVAKLLTTDEALYCLMVCYDEKKNIQKNTGKLDDSGGDVVSLMLDTFGDRRTAYKFAVTASGVRSDCRLLDDARNRDYSWDGVWFAKSKVYDWGFVIEMRVPYRSIKYNESLTTWGLDFDLWIPARTEDIYWCRYEENEGQRISKFGRLEFGDSHPSAKGLNLEIYPVGISKATYLRGNKYDFDPDAGIDIFYNPSQRLTFQLTGNPDFAQIEADPFAFNISRYETYFDERRPFFTEGNEVFMPSGRQRNTGFYRPLELFYSRRIGKNLPNGKEVPLQFGTKAFGRLGEWEYGGFLALTGEQEYKIDNENFTEPRAGFASARLKKQILDNSSIGVLFVGKKTENDFDGVLDVDGAFRASNWQLSYQLARSIKNSQDDFAGSAGFTQFRDKWITLVRSRYIGKDFDVNQVGFVPWKGTAELTALTGPRWYFKEGAVREMLLYSGGILNYERVDEFTDRSAILGFNMQFRKNWGYEVTFITGRSKDQNKEFNSYEIDYSTWFNPSPQWSGNVYGGYSRTYNFARDYLAFYSWFGSSFNWHALKVLDLGTSLNAFVEGNPRNKIEDITWNARPYFSLTPVNDLNVRVYVDNVYLRSTRNVRQVIAGLLFSYNFSPKSWIYFAINELHDRQTEYDIEGNLVSDRLKLTDRVGVTKLKYLYYF